MKLSQGVEWCLHLAVLLAQLPENTILPRSQMARHHGLPEDYLAKYLKQLVNAGIFQATTGPRGGYRLGRGAAQITAWDVVEALEGGQSPFHCQEIRQCGEGAARPEECLKTCGIQVLIDSAFEAWKYTLQGVTIANLEEEVPDFVRERNRRRLLQAGT